LLFGESGIGNTGGDDVGAIDEPPHAPSSIPSVMTLRTAMKRESLQGEPFIYRMPSPVVWYAREDRPTRRDQPAMRPPLLLNERNAIAARTSSGTDVSDATPTVALASTKTMTAKIVNSRTSATTDDLPVSTPRFYARPSSRSIPTPAQPARRGVGLRDLVVTSTNVMADAGEKAEVIDAIADLIADAIWADVYGPK